ncbi:TIM barrel protein [Paramaledivibacter caminithermalis]|uniref:Sugar phosphate isomerase/epimerase n=1 Tax=Paramaledivibacter caminithermalis (strain DSM 15212 / CIP 107654 / DViRD3) TaxID=1121301 RepID=A0A1M6KJZ1_PARC5|nr:TIM barrel protein [Paramaledivibacter caminithermalis]SHJ59283.1 Sugar phosphate isomerase/epimerase [Paramaledivibacter caminithermalis DSM 15212]
MKNIINLGINTVNINIQKAVELGFGRVELCLGKEKFYADKLYKFYEKVNRAEKLDLPYSIHLPVYVEEWYPYDYFSAFFIDEDINKRELSFRLLEYNLENLRDCRPSYFVLHFPGISEEWENPKEFSKILCESLNRINEIAKKYDAKINLEYFGSNKNFWDYNKWIEKISKYKNLGILTDTGHLYFASIICKFDFIEALKTLSSNSDAFHIWTTKGDKAYRECKFYKQYHHIGPHIEQMKADGWAFDTKEVIEIIAKQNKPIIIEPSIKYKGSKYLIEGIKSVIKYFQ